MSETTAAWHATFAFDDVVTGWQCRVSTPVDPADADGADRVVDAVVRFQPPGGPILQGWSRAWLRGQDWLRLEVVFTGEEAEITPTCDRFVRQGELLIKHSLGATTTHRVPPAIVPTWLHWLALEQLPALPVGASLPFAELREDLCSVQAATWETTAAEPFPGAPAGLVRVAVHHADGSSGNTYWVDGHRRIWRADWQGPVSQRVDDVEALLARVPAAVAAQARRAGALLAQLEQGKDQPASGAELSALPIQPMLLPRLRALVVSPDVALRRASLQVAGAWRDPALPGLLRTAGLWDPAQAAAADPAVLCALGRCGVPAAVAAMTRRIADPDPYMRGEAAYILSVHGWTAATPALAAALPPADDLVFGECALALGRLRHAPARAALLAALHGAQAQADSWVWGGATGSASLKLPLWQVVDEALNLLAGDGRPSAADLAAARARWPLAADAAGR